MSRNKPPLIFGEVLFDCFPGGERRLGGAPFNVAWHLQAFGKQPRFISRIGNDELGSQIIHAMQQSEMDQRTIQTDDKHPTGTVQIAITNNEPSYTITPNVAYDFIEPYSFEKKSNADKPDQTSLLYHGTLALRHKVSQETLRDIVKQIQPSIFLDVNLRTPWWKLDDVMFYLKQARWAKLNQEELYLLQQNSGDLATTMTHLQQHCDLELLIVTLGSEGAITRNKSGGIHRIKPSSASKFVDAVGAGDAFTAVYLHGLLSNWPISLILERAQQFAVEIVGIRGAIPQHNSFYSKFS